jgi:peptidoglycan pentaglycine glycine transferase (the first glycine)
VNTIRIPQPAPWQDLLTALPRPHLLQSWAWGDLKAKYGWRADRLAWRDRDGKPAAAAQVLMRSQGLSGLPLRLTVAYCPRGPVLDWRDRDLARRVLADLGAEARRRGAIFLKIDPEIILGVGQPDLAGAGADAEAPVLDDLRRAGWRPSAEQIQFRNTFALDLRPSEDDLLAGMKQKTRYNIRLAERRGVRVRPGGLGDLELLYRMYAETALRDGFAIRKPAYYRDTWGAFIEAGLAQPLIAEVGNEPVAGLIVYRYGETAWYLYGMSREAHRQAMPNHLLQWEAIRWARTEGCTTYDFWGAPDRLQPGDPMWGVYRFKAGFGARVVRTVGAWDLPLQPVLYLAYGLVMPRLMGLLRRRGRRQTQQSLEA